MRSAELVYCIVADDVRIEMGNKISLMGIFQNIMVEKLPVSLIKFAVINHWTGEGDHETEVRILSPDRNNLAPRIGIAFQPTRKTVIRSGFGLFYGQPDAISHDGDARFSHQPILPRASP